MIKLFKSLGLGVFIVLTSPIWALAFLLFLVLIITRYIVGEILSVFYYFRGYNYLLEDEYDIALEEAMEKNIEEKKNNKPIYVQAIPDKYIDPRFFKDSLDEEDDEDE